MPLLSLPHEIRNRVYTWYFILCSPPHDPDSYVKPAPLRSIRIRTPTTLRGMQINTFDHQLHDFFGLEVMTRLLRTCHCICEEATQVLYSTFTFNFLDLTVCDLWFDFALSRLGQRQRSLVRSVRFGHAPEKHLQQREAAGIARLVQLLPNVRRVTLVPLIQVWACADMPPVFDVSTIEEYTDSIMALFSKFRRVRVCEIEHLEGMPLFKGGELHDGYDLLPQQVREGLKTRLVKHNADLAAGCDGQKLVEARPAAMIHPSKDMERKAM